MPWRANAFAVLRVAFGVVWAVDAMLKWQPAFQSGFAAYLTGALDGQPPLIKAWIGFWIDIVQVNPQAFALIVAVGESALAIGLIFGLSSNLAALGGLLLTSSYGRPPRALADPMLPDRLTSALPSSIPSCLSRSSFPKPGFSSASTNT